MGRRRIDRYALRKALFLVFLLTSILFFLNTGKFTGMVVQEKGIIFVELNIPSEYEQTHPGGTILVETNILQRGVGIDESTPIELEYSIIDSAGSILAKKESRSALATKISGITSLLIPTTVNPGVYTAAVKVTTLDGATAVGSHTFEVREREKENSLLLIGAYAFMIFFIIFVLTFSFYKFFSRSRPRF